MDSFADVRNDLFDFLDDFSHYWDFDSLDDFLDSDFLESDLYNFFDLLGHLDNLLDFPFDWNELFDDSVNWDWDFDWDCEGSVDLDDLFDLDDLGNESFNLKFSWYFDLNFNDLLAFFFDDLDSVNDSLNWDDLFNHLFNDSVNLVVDVLDDFDFLDSFLDNGNLD